MKDIRHIILHVLLAVLTGGAAVVLTACRDSAPEQYEPRGMYFEVTVRPTGTAPYRHRGPQGGNAGDGREWGLENENEVRNVTLLIYRDQQGINGSAATPVELALYAPLMNLQDDGSYRSDRLHYDRPLPVGSYHVLALVNVGDRTDLMGRPLGEVRELVADAPFDIDRAADGRPRVETARRFVMTSAEDVTFSVGYGASLETPVGVEIPVERLAARIDFSPGTIKSPAGAGVCEWVTDVPAESEGKPLSLTGYRYTVLDGATGEPTADRYILTGATPFNCLSSGSYFVKRVETDFTGASGVEYLGDEQVGGDDNANNCVLDPWTHRKTDGRPEGLSYRNSQTGGNANATTLAPWPVKAGKELFTPARYNPEGLRYYILDYTLENTILPGSRKELFATGILFSGYYGKAGADGSMNYHPQNYFYYIRHVDPNDSSDEALPMKYGIVRNNIYRVHINSVNSLGHIEIVVNDWRHIDVPEIQI